MCMTLKENNECLDCQDYAIEEGQFITESEVRRTPSGSIVYRGETFPGYNKPKIYKGDGKYKKRVLAKEGDKIRIVNFGDRNYSDFTKHKNKDRRSNFRKRHNCQTATDKTTARYWSCKNLWGVKKEEYTPTNESQVIIITESQLKALVEAKENKENKENKGNKLCARGIKAAKAKFDVWPSAYASAFAVQVCKGTKKGLDNKMKKDFKD